LQYGKKEKNINEIIAVKKGNYDIEVKSQTDGIDLDTPFMIGSITRQFAGVLALKYLKSVLAIDVTTLLTGEQFRALIGRLSDNCNKWSIF
jgi:hypothetical protein